MEGSGIAASEARDVPPFSSVALVGSNDVEIRVGEQATVVVHADDNLIDRVTIEVRDRTLEIGNKRGMSIPRAPTKVEVTVPALDSVSLSGSGAISATGIERERFAVVLGGSGLVRAAGRVDSLDVALTGSGDADLGELPARTVNVQVNGSGRATVTATETLVASVPGSGAIVYGGDPTNVRTSVPGAGVILRR
jgi:hypothetical protein